MGTASEISSPAGVTAQPGGPAIRWRRVFPGDAIQVSEARHWVISMLPKCPARADAVLVASELCTNACQHTASGRGGIFILEITWQDTTVRVTVADGGAATGPYRVDDRMAERGRGLAIVSELCSHTGVSGDHRGRVIWGEVPWDGPGVPPAAAPGYEAAIRDGLAGLADRCHGVPAWFGRSTCQWWALAGRPGALHLVTARTPGELGDLIDSLQACQRMPLPPIPDPVAARADRRNHTARVPAPPRPHPPRLPLGNLRPRP